MWNDDEDVTPGAADDYPEMPEAIKVENRKPAAGKANGHAAASPDEGAAPKGAKRSAAKAISKAADGAKPAKGGKVAAKAKTAPAAKPEPVKAKAQSKDETKAKASTKGAKPDPKKGGKPFSRNADNLDKFGLVKGSIRSQAVAMYATKNGATLAEVKEKVGSNQFNVITILEARGFKVERNEVLSGTGRKVTKYKIHPKV